MSGDVSGRGSADGRATAGLAAAGLGAVLGGRQVLGGVDLAVGPGEWHAVIGPNGAGKSTLLRVLAGLLRHDGTVRLGGEDAARLSARQRARRLAYVPQQPTLPGAMSVRAYVLLGRTPHLSYLAAEGAADRAVAEAAMDRLTLTAYADRRLGTLSGGERQRVVLARAVAQRADTLLLDEPTTALDLGHRAQVMELVDELRRDEGLAVLSTEHDLNLAAAYADRLLLLVGGRLAAVGAPAEVLTAELVERHYGVGVHVVRDERGAPVVIPRRPARTTS